ncbi:winged helix DNA-binding protein [Methanobrevibacter sp.]
MNFPFDNYSIPLKFDDNSNHVSKYLKTLKEEELVECLNEEDKRYRFYSITDKGKYYLDKVEKDYKD